MSLKDKITEGQEVIIVPYGNNASGGNTEPRKAIITSIRRTYFDVCYLYDNDQKSHPIQFMVADGRQKNTGFGYGRDWVLYLTEQEIKDEQETAKLTEAIRNRIGQYGTTDIKLNVLREVAKMLNV